MIQYDNTIYSESSELCCMQSHIKGMTDSLRGEKLRFKGGREMGSLRFGELDGEGQRKVRRIVEKRVSQKYWNRSGRSPHHSSYGRYRVEKYTSNQMKNLFGWDYALEGVAA